jgi:LacI family transcriptional regulator
MKVRLSDIAARAEISLSAASLALQGKQGVSSETAERVKRIAKELGYKASKKSDRHPAFIQFVKIVKHGNILNQAHVPFIADYADGLMEEGRTLFRSVMISSFALSETDLPSIVKRLDASGSAGAIILGTELDAEDIARFSELSIPCVFIDAYYDYLPFSFFDMNNSDSVASIAQSLFRAGHRRIGIVQGSSLSPNFVLRESAFRESLDRLGLAVERRILVGSRFDEARVDMRGALAGGEGELPTAFFCVNDVIALGVMRALVEEGVAVPGRVSVVGFDDLEASAMASPPLATVSVPKRRIAKRALRSLVEAIERGERPSEKTLVSGELILRESVAPPARDALY